jgi:hypothetical protein
LLQPAQKIQSGFSGIRSQHSVALLVVLLQIALDGAEDIRIVVDGQYDWLLHLPKPLPTYGTPPMMP